MTTIAQHNGGGGGDVDGTEAMASMTTQTRTEGPHRRLLLNKWQAAALLTAECVGVGILALPQGVHVLGWSLGLAFLLVNLPINYYAGSILALAAAHVEQSYASYPSDCTSSSGSTPTRNVEMTVVVGSETTAVFTATPPPLGQHDIDDNGGSRDGRNDSSDRESISSSNHPPQRTFASEILLSSSRRQEQHHRYERTPTPLDDLSSRQGSEVGPSINSTFPFASDRRGDGIFVANKFVCQHSKTSHSNDEDHDDVITAAVAAVTTADFVTISSNLFRGSPAWITRTVVVIYYMNIFLVLGDYLLVMSHAVTAMMGPFDMCLPMAGALAAILMFAISQLNTMTGLGREASVLSLLALLIVLFQCLLALRNSTSYNEEYHYIKRSSETDDGSSVLRKFSALASIGFAVGSQKLFLNIRNSMAQKHEAPETLAISLTSFGLVYLLVVVLAGPDPPSLLFDAIPEGLNRQVAGFLLWGHVAVSYAINSQALCSSIDRSFFHGIQLWGLNDSPRRRWLVLTLSLTFLSYMVSNAIPFFKDLVSFIGALTTVPLSLTLPAVMYQKACSYASALQPSSLLLAYSLFFLVIGLMGSLSSIEKDWRLHGLPFSCTE